MVTNVQAKHSMTFESMTENVYHANAGEGLAKHEHTFQHATVCHSGRLAVRKEDLYVELTKESQPVMLKENEWHELEALEDGTVFCNIFSIVGGGY